jgi:hypothetical protein
VSHVCKRRVGSVRRLNWYEATDLLERPSCARLGAKDAQNPSYRSTLMATVLTSNRDVSEPWASQLTPCPLNSCQSPRNPERKLVTEFWAIDTILTLPDHTEVAWFLTLAPAPYADTCDTSIHPGRIATGLIRTTSHSGYVGDVGRPMVSLDLALSRPLVRCETVAGVVRAPQSVFKDGQRGTLQGERSHLTGVRYEGGSAVTCENSKYSNDLHLVRRQLDGLASVRATSGFCSSEHIRYQELCEKELLLLAEARSFALAS